MNILPKKSWHVRNKDNVERVRKDEENARLAEKEQIRRAELAEQEARTKYLRQKARTRMLETGNEHATLPSTESIHSKNQIVPTNFFSDANLERGASSSLKNTEHEKEKKAEQVEYEKKIGLLTYLGQSAVESKDDADKPWYFKMPDRNMKRKSTDDSGERDIKRKTYLDPMGSMKEHVRLKKELETQKPKSKKAKKHRKHKHKEKKERDVPRESCSSDKLDKLRKERLARERKERERAAALLSGKEITDNSNDAPGRYNSQFNPHLVRPRKKY